jgi:hypothetical protein
LQTLTTTSVNVWIMLNMCRQVHRRQHVLRGLRCGGIALWRQSPVFNFAPGENFTPWGERGPQGWTFHPRGEVFSLGW